MPQQQVNLLDGSTIFFEVDAFKKDCLVRGLDDIGLTLQHTDEIKAYEQQRQQTAPWLFPSA